MSEALCSGLVHESLLHAISTAVGCCSMYDDNAANGQQCPPCVPYMRRKQRSETEDYTQRAIKNKSRPQLAS